MQSRAAGVRAQFQGHRLDVALEALPEVFAFTASGGYSVWTEAAAAGVLHAVPWFKAPAPACEEAARFTLPLPPSAVITAIAAPPTDWKGTAEISTSSLLLLDGASAGSGIHLCTLENHAGITARWPAPAGGVPVDAAFSPGGIFLLNSPADRTDFSPVPADISARLFRRDGSTWAACTTDLPLTDPTALAADPRPQQNGELLVLCGHRQPAEAPGSQRFLARLIPDGTDRYRVEVIADNFMTPAPGGLEISHDGTRLVVADKGAKVWYGWCDKNSARGWD